MSKRVVVIHSNQDYASDYTPFPPIGATGDVISAEDEHGEFDVMFDDFLCPTPADPSWITHKSMVVFIGGNLRGNIGMLTLVDEVA